MLARLRNHLAIAVSSVITASGLATGLALGCNGNYCNGNTFGCTQLSDKMQDSCCVDLDGDGLKHCALCWRDQYLCYGGLVLGSAYGCTNSGSICS